MYRLLLDTSVLLDAMEPGRPESNEACKVLERCNGAGDMGMACAMSLKDVYYVLCKLRGEALAREGVRMLMGLVVVAPTGAEEADLAMCSNEPDFETVLFAPLPSLTTWILLLRAIGRLLPTPRFAA